MRIFVEGLGELSKDDIELEGITLISGKFNTDGEGIRGFYKHNFEKELSMSIDEFFKKIKVNIETPKIFHNENDIIKEFEDDVVYINECRWDFHPQEQIKFAKIIVELYKLTGRKFIIRTVNPYFIKAMQVYSALSEISNKCKYYLYDREENIIKDCTDDIEQIYEPLALPLQELEDDRWRDDDDD